MKKKTISMILGMVLALSVFGGCGSTGTAAPSAAMRRKRQQTRKPQYLMTA